MDARQGAGGFPPYVSTGKTPILGLLFGLAAGAVVAPILAAIYAFAIVYIPFVYILALLTVAFGAGIGFATGMVMHVFKVRSGLMVGLAGVLLGGFGWLVSWPIWVRAVMGQAEVDITMLQLLDPFVLVQAIGLIYETGTWGIGSSGDAVSGWFLAIFWLIEAVLVVGASGFVAFASGGERLFCESCESWCTVMPMQALYDSSAQGPLTQAITATRDLSVLSSAPAPTEGNTWLELKLAFCGCGATNIVGIEQAAETIDSKGRKEQVRTPCVGFHCIEKTDFERLRGALAQRAQGATPAQPVV